MTGGLHRYRFGLVLGVIALAATLFRFAIADYSLWFDEQASMFFAAQPLGLLWSGWMIREPNPPLYYSLLKGWITLFGDSEPAARSLSITAGAGCIVTTALFTAGIYGRRAAMIAAGLTALSGQQLYFSLQVRGYELGCLAASGVLIGLLSIERCWRLRCAPTGSLAVYTLGCTACIYLHTTMLLLPVICTSALVIVRRSDLLEQPRLLLPLLAANLAIALAAGWWLDITLRQMLAGLGNNAVFDRITPWIIVQASARALTFAKETGAAKTLIAIVVILIVIGQLRRSWAMPETRLLASVLGVSIGLLGLISIAVPVFLPRTIFWLSTVSTALCAAAIAGIGQRWVRWSATGGLGLLVAANMATSAAVRQREDWTGAIARAEDLPGSQLIVHGEAMGLLLQSACARSHHGRCGVPIVAITTADDRLDPWAIGLFPGRVIPADQIDRLPNGSYFVFRKEVYHDLLKSLHQRGRARAIHDDPPLLGPVDRSVLIR